MSDQTPAPREEGGSANFPPVEIMQRMVELQEKRLALDAKQLDITERELDHNKEIALKSMELNSAAVKSRDRLMTRMLAWRYGFWSAAVVVAGAAIIAALYFGKEAFVIEALKYLAVFVGGYGTNAAVQSKRKSPPQPEEES